jgi:murein DD-endopeptidase MepM/ murein hydrolase activator NlpD
MVEITVQLNHIASSSLELGDRVFFKDPVAVYGNTGKSFGEHLHASAIDGHTNQIKMLDIESGIQHVNKVQLYKFINNHLFKGPYHITTRYLEEGYKEKYGEGLYEHHAVDLVSLDRDSKKVYWPIHSPGIVVNRGFNTQAGNFIVFQYVDDITGHFAEEAIRDIIEEGKMIGYPDGTFKPDKPLTRAEYALIEYRGKEVR